MHITNDRPPECGNAPPTLSDVNNHFDSQKSQDSLQMVDALYQSSRLPPPSPDSFFISASPDPILGIPSTPPEIPGGVFPSCRDGYVPLIPYVPPEAIIQFICQSWLYPWLCHYVVL